MPVPVYYNQMLDLPMEHPEVYGIWIFEEWGRVCTVGDGKHIWTHSCWSSNWGNSKQNHTDNRGHDSLNPGAVSKYYLTTEYRSICLPNLREMVYEKQTGVSHADLKPTKIKKMNKAHGLSSMYYNRHGWTHSPQKMTCWISFAPIFSFIYCWVLIFALSPCYILIYMF